MNAVLNVAQVTANMMVLGYGQTRAGLWVQGCHLGCPGCSSLHTHDPARGRLVAVDKIIDWLRGHSKCMDGLTISGGEPMQQADSVLALIRAFRDAFGESDILMYSGLTWRELIRRYEELIKACDVVIAGPYVQTLPALPLRGSSNQTVHVLTPLARERYHDVDRWPVHAIQASFRNDRLITVGIPDAAKLSDSIQANPVFDANTASWIQPKSEH
ncbi:MAG: 4Fe-4S single cluster domain-containing protein [Blastocatellia bacterium]